jgi:hypothetical protein
MNIFKSKQEKEIERKIKAKQGKKTVERHVQRQKANLEKYRGLAKRAYRLDDTKMFEQIATFILATQRDVTQWERRLVYFDMVEAQRDQVLAAAEFAQAYQEMAKSMLASANPADLAKIQKDIEVAMMRSDMMEEVMENLMELSEGVLQEVRSEDKSNELKQIMADLQSEAVAESQAPSDSEIEASLRKIEEQIKRG